jgi:hypothetical protein
MARLKYTTLPPKCATRSSRTVSKRDVATGRPNWSRLSIPTRLPCTRTLPLCRAFFSPSDAVAAVSFSTPGFLGVGIVYILDCTGQKNARPGRRRDLGAVAFVPPLTPTGHPPWMGFVQLLSRARSCSNSLVRYGSSVWLARRLRLARF